MYYNTQQVSQQEIRLTRPNKERRGCELVNVEFVKHPLVSPPLYTLQGPAVLTFSHLLHLALQRQSCTTSPESNNRDPAVYLCCVLGRHPRAPPLTKHDLPLDTWQSVAGVTQLTRCLILFQRCLALPHTDICRETSISFASVLLDGL